MGIRGVGGIRGLLGTGRDCWSSGARRGIGGIRRYWEVPRMCKGAVLEVSGVLGCQGCLGAGRDSRYSTARRDTRGIRGNGGLLGGSGV